MERSIVPSQRLSHSPGCRSENIGKSIWRLDQTGCAAPNTPGGAGDTGAAVGGNFARRATTMSHRVLIVDDEAGIRQALKQVLEYEDLVVRVTASGGEAITVYAEFRPHLVFLDVKMAGLDGLETLSRLRDLDPKAQVVM